MVTAAHRIMTAGSVDDGKSTLIGRMLYDLDLIEHDILDDLRDASVRRGRGELDLSLYTDGLTAEREQGITIDVAYRYFKIEGQSFILADTPGHVQYTRNMVCAASQSDVALIMIDARSGPTEQTRRHTILADLLGVRHRIFVVNKLDLVGFSQERFDQVERELRALIVTLGKNIALTDAASAHAEVSIIPVCALDGDNVVRKSDRLGWFQGPTLIDLLLADARIRGFDANAAFRFPVQGLIRPTGGQAGQEWHDFRGLSGRIESGSVSVGDEIRVAGGTTGSRVAQIHTYDGDLQQAVAGQSVSLVLEDDLDVARGDVLVDTDDSAAVSSRLSVDLCWMSENAGAVGQRVLIKQASRTVAGRISAIESLLDIEAGVVLPADAQDRGPRLPMNSISRVVIDTASPLLADAYSALPQTGAIIVIEPTRFDTLAAGLIRA